MYLEKLEPVVVEDVLIAFPASVKHLMPEHDSIPEEFKNSYGNKWVQLQRDWFYNGLNGKFVPKEGIDLNLALRHLSCIQGSFEPKHEHKEAAVAYLMSLWFESYEKKEEENKSE